MMLQDRENPQHQLTAMLQNQTDKPILYTDASKFQNYAGCAVTLHDEALLPWTKLQPHWSTYPKYWSSNTAKKSD